MADSGNVEIRLRWDVMMALITAIGAFLFQGAAGVWYASQFDARLRVVEGHQLLATEEFKKLEDAREGTGLKLQNIEDKLDLLLSRPANPVVSAPGATVVTPGGGVR